jgi:hypothetical protein
MLQNIQIHKYDLHKCTNNLTHDSYLSTVHRKDRLVSEWLTALKHEMLAHIKTYVNIYGLCVIWKPHSTCALLLLTTRSLGCSAPKTSSSCGGLTCTRAHGDSHPAAAHAQCAGRFWGTDGGGGEGQLVLLLVDVTFGIYFGNIWDSKFLWVYRSSGVGDYHLGVGIKGELASQLWGTNLSFIHFNKFHLAFKDLKEWIQWLRSWISNLWIEMPLGPSDFDSTKPQLSYFKKIQKRDAWHSLLASPSQKKIHILGSPWTKMEHLG